MLCPRCGMQLLDEEESCPSCGRPVDREDDGADDTLLIGSDDPTLVGAPGAEPAAGAEFLTFGGDYIADDPARGDDADSTDPLGSEFPTNVSPAFDDAQSADPDKNLRRDLDPLAGSGALDAIESLYDTGGMQFPISGMEDRARNRTRGKDILPTSTHADQPFSHRHRKSLFVTIAVVIAALVVAGTYFFAFFGPTHAVSDDELRSVLAADDEFMQGRASDQFTDEDPYTIANLKTDSRVADDEGLTIKATVHLKNGFFDETDHITVAFPDRHDPSNYKLGIDSHEVKAIRGISRDPEYGISGVNPTFDQAAQACVVEQHRTDGSSNRWWFTESGDIRLAYEFSGDTWKRTEADTSSLVSSYQHIVGPYGVGDTRFASFEIRSVDNETGEFTGTFSWVKDGAGWFGSSTMDGHFTGRVQRDGSVEVSSGGEAGSIGFTGSFGDGNTLTISGTVYLDSTWSKLGFSDAPTETFNSVTLTKGESMEPVESADGQEEGSPAEGSGL